MGGSKKVLSRWKRRPLNGEFKGKEIKTDVFFAQNDVSFCDFSQEKNDRFADQAVAGTAKKINDLFVKIRDRRNVRQAGFLAKLSHGRFEIGLAGINVPLGKIPVPAIVKQEKSYVGGVAFPAMKNQETCGSFLMCHSQLLNDRTGVPQATGASA